MFPILNSPSIASVYGYWMKISRNGVLPPIGALEPNQISNPVCHLYFAGVEKDDAGTRFKFRPWDYAPNVAQGQHIAARLQLLSQLVERSDELRQNLVCAAKVKLPVVDMSKIETANGFSFKIEHLALPLSDDGETVTKIFGAIDLVEIEDINLENSMPNFDWRSISSVEIEKRLLISNLRTQRR